MKNAKVSDFNGYVSDEIIIHSKWFYIFRLGGFFIGVVIPSIGILSMFVIGEINRNVFYTFLLVPIGFIGFILSFKAPSFCKACGSHLETYWSNEVRANKQYSGTISVCDKCKKFETRISSDSEG
jgi:hypothetical protein